MCAAAAAARAAEIGSGSTGAARWVGRRHLINTPTVSPRRPASPRPVRRPRPGLPSTGADARTGTEGRHPAPPLHVPPRSARPDQHDRRTYGVDGRCRTPPHAAIGPSRYRQAQPRRGDACIGVQGRQSGRGARQSGRESGDIRDRTLTVSVRTNTTDQIRVRDIGIQRARRQQQELYLGAREGNASCACT